MSTTPNILFISSAEPYKTPKPDTRWWKSWLYPWYTQPAAYAHTSKIILSSSKLTTQFERYCRNQTLRCKCHLGSSSYPNSTSATNLTAPSKLNAFWTLSTISNKLLKRTNGHFMLMVRQTRREQVLGSC